MVSLRYLLSFDGAEMRAMSESRETDTQTIKAGKE